MHKMCYFCKISSVNNLGTLKTGSTSFSIKISLQNFTIKRHIVRIEKGDYAQIVFL